MSGVSIGIALLPGKLLDVSIPSVRDAAPKAGRQPLVVETTLSNLGRAEFRRQAEKVLPTLEEIIGWATVHFRRLGVRPHRSLPLSQIRIGNPTFRRY